MQLSDLRQAIMHLTARPSAELDARVHDHINAAVAKRKEQHSGGFLPNPWNIIMRTPMTKWTAATFAVVAIFTGVILLDKGATSAFGIEQIIAAYKSVRTLHVRTFRDTNSPPTEFWIKTDDSGHVAKARYFLPGTEDGDKLITWIHGKAEVWFKSKHGFLTLYGEQADQSLQGLVDECQPEALIRALEGAQKKGQIVLQTQGPSIIFTNKAHQSKRVILIDPQSHLISSVSDFSLTNDVESLTRRIEYSEYNVPIDDSMFSLREQLPPDVRIADTLNQVTGVEQYPGVTDDGAAAETARQFFQALIDKDYKAAGLIMGGEREVDARKQLSVVNVTSILSIGAAELQTNWVPRGYQVPCQLEVTRADGSKIVWKSGPFVRPGDNRQHPERWHITGGVNPTEVGIVPLPETAPERKMSAKQAAAAFFKACSESNWTEVLKFWPGSPSDPQFERMKPFLAGLQLISLGEAYQDTTKYPGWYVPYQIRIQPQEEYVLVANTNAAHRYVLVGEYDSKMQPREMIEWDSAPQILPDTDAAARMTPLEVVIAATSATTNMNWTDLSKYTSAADVAQTRRQFDEAKKAGADVQANLPFIQVIGPAPSSDPSAVFVKVRVCGVKKWNLAVRNDNPDHRFFFDGGL